ncbi:MAG: hypothetical protein JJE35_14280, partial [Thermoleophilia bacterium]|nr:hypothetical protein [Thermoleophilia bacterium]
DEEEHVDPSQGNGVDGEEVAGDHALRLVADELTPGEATTFSGWAEPGVLMNPWLATFYEGRDLIDSLL